MFFKCKHPFDSLVAQDKERVVSVDRDFERRVWPLKCIKCGASLECKFVTLVGGVDAFLAREPWEIV